MKDKLKLNANHLWHGLSVTKSGHFPYQLKHTTQARAIWFLWRMQVLKRNLKKRRICQINIALREGIILPAAVVCIGNQQRMSENHNRSVAEIKRSKLD